MKELENGFSVSETSESVGDDIHSSAPSSRIGGGFSLRHSPRDLMGFNSHLISKLPRTDMNPQMAAGGSSILDLEARVRFE